MPSGPTTKGNPIPRTVMPDTLRSAAAANTALIHASFWSCVGRTGRSSTPSDCRICFRAQRPLWVLFLGSFPLARRLQISPGYTSDTSPTKPEGLPWNPAWAKAEKSSMEERINPANGIPVGMTAGVFPAAPHSLSHSRKLFPIEARPCGPSIIVDLAILISEAINRTSSFAGGWDHSHFQKVARSRFCPSQVSPQTSIARQLMAYRSVRSTPRLTPLKVVFIQSHPT